MQDDFKVPTTPSDNVPSPAAVPAPQPAVQSFTPPQVQDVTPPPAPVATSAWPTMTTGPTVADSSPADPAPAAPAFDSPATPPEATPSFDTSPVASPTPPAPQAPLPPLVPSDPGPIPPATSTYFPTSTTGPTFGGPTGPVSGGGFGGPSGPTMGAAPAPAGKPKKPLIVGGIAVALLALVGVVYVFAFYLPNTPANVYSSSVKNTGTALDALITYSKQQEHTQYTSSSFTGGLTAKSPGASYDVNVTGAVDKNANGNIQMNADIMGEKLNANIISVKAANDTSPDVYVQVTGIKNTLDSIGLNQYDYLDGQWIVIDHTLVDSYLSALSSGGTSGKTSAPTYAEVQDAIAKVQTVNKQYLFTTNAKYAVLTNEKFVASEKTGGKTLNHYTVGYDKAHLSAYVGAVGSALDSSQLNTWHKGVSGGKNLSQEMNVSSLQSKINSASGNYTFNMWADKKTKLVAKVSLADPSDKTSVISISQGYNGGTTFPFSIGFTGKDSSGDPEAANLNLTLDTKTNKTAVTFTSNTTSSDGMTNISGNLSFTPSNNAVNAVAPKNAKSLTDLLVSLGLSGSTDPSNVTTSTGTTQSTQPTFPLTSVEHKLVTKY